MVGESIPHGEIVGIVIGAVALFSLISLLPMVIMWHHRRHAATRRASETLDLTSSMQQVSVERWLEEQNIPGNASHYAQDICAICLSSLSSSPYLSSPDSAHLPRSPGSHVSSMSEVRPKQGSENCVLVLNQCHHAFHFTCLTSWFEYQTRTYKCPTCQASYSPVETRV